MPRRPRSRHRRLVLRSRHAAGRSSWGCNRGKDFVPVGRVGTGFRPRQSRSAHESGSSHGKRKPSPFQGKVAVPGGRNIHWVKPELVAEIEFAGLAEGATCASCVQGPKGRQPARRFEAEKPTLPAAGGIAVQQAAQTCAARRGAAARGASPRGGVKQSAADRASTRKEERWQEGGIRSPMVPARNPSASQREPSWASASRSPTKRCGRMRRW